MKIYTLVLNWNGEKYISDTLESLTSVDTGEHEHKIVVVDNDSSDGSVNLIKSKFPHVTLLQNPVNMGFAAGNNRGLKHIMDQNPDYVWVINSDITVAKDSLKKFLEGVEKFPLAGIFGCKIYFAPGFEFQKGRYKPNELGKVIWYAGGIIDWKNLIGSHRGVDEVDKGQYDVDLETDYVTGAVMFIKASVLKSIGFFDPKYCFYYEENDLCQRAKRRGFHLIYLGLPSAWHRNAESTGMGSPLQDYFITRNRLLFGLKYAPLRTKYALLRESLQLKKSGREWQKKGVEDFFHLKFGAGSYELK